MQSPVNGCVSAASRIQTRASGEADVIGTWSDFLEITSSNKDNHKSFPKNKMQ